jgi:hypothetical protein
MNYLRNRTAIFSILVMVNLGFVLVSSQSAMGENTMVDATETTWGIISTDDGFDKTLTIYKDADNLGIDDFGDDITYSAEIQCTKKKLTFMVYSDPIGIYPSTTLNSIDGYALAKVDSGKVIKYPYISLKDSSGIFFNSPKIVTSAILKGKNTFSFKIPSSIQNATVTNFTIGNLPTFVPRFKSLGCPLK